MINTQLSNKLNQRETTLLHGTSIEAAKDMLIDGRLGLKPYSKRLVTKKFKRKLYFAPYCSNIPQPFLPRAREFYNSWEEVLEMAKDYATLNARIHYITSKIGYYDINAEDLPWSKKGEGHTFPSPQANNMEMISLEKFLRKASKRGINEDRIIRIINEASQRRGAIISIGSKGLELDIKDDLDEGVYVYLLTGLEIAYVTAIEAQSIQEHEELWNKHNS